MAVAAGYPGHEQCGSEDSNFIPEDIKNNNASEPGRSEKLDEDTERQILQAYLEKLQNGGRNAHLTINDVWVEQYLGAYCPMLDTDMGMENYSTYTEWFDDYYYGAGNQTVFAVMMGAQDNGTEQQELSIMHDCGRTFVRDGNTIFLWHEGQLYALEDHFDSNNGGDRLLFGWDFLKIANIQNGLDFETQLKIQEDFGKSMPNLIPGSVYYNEIPIHYLGAWNGYIVVFAQTGVAFPVGFHQEIEGVHFYAHSGGTGSSYNYRLFAWKEGDIYKLQDLYKLNLITREDLVQMAYNLHAVKEGE
jgi:hypothetical protein